MIIGIGFDLVEVDRIRELLERHPDRAKARLFTPLETQYCQERGDPVQSFAARFAAKEALFKALGTGVAGGANWREVEVFAGPEGAPSVLLHGTARELAEVRGVSRIHISLTHTRQMAGATIVLEGGPGDRLPERSI